jgi:dihydrofolate reductase
MARKLVVLSFISLDGVIQAPGGEGEDPSGGFDLEGWVVPYFDEAGGKEMEKQMRPPFDLLLGKTTYDIFASYWPEHADQWPGINEATKYVASHEPMKLTWEKSVQLQGEAAKAIKELKAEDGPDLQVHGSGVLIQTLLKHDLVDELWLKTFPVALGKGKRLFGEGVVPAAFKLTGSMVTPSGVIFASYERDGEVRTGTFS